MLPAPGDPGAAFPDMMLPPMELPAAGAALPLTPQMMPAAGAAMPDVAMSAPAASFPDIICAPRAFTAPVHKKRKQGDRPADFFWRALSAVRALHASQISTPEFHHQMAEHLHVLENVQRQQENRLLDTEAKLENTIQACHEMRQKLDLAVESEHKAKQQVIALKKLTKVVRDRENAIANAIGPGVEQLCAEEINDAARVLDTQKNKAIKNMQLIDEYTVRLADERAFRDALEKLTKEPSTEHYFCPISGKPMHYPVVVEYAANEPGASEPSEPRPRHLALQSYNVCELLRLQTADGVFTEPGTGRRCVGFFCNTALMHGLRTLVRELQTRRAKQTAVLRSE
jgi:hypothetical protein